MAIVAAPSKHLLRLLDRIEEAAKGATPGRWRRNHGCITSFRAVRGENGQEIRCERHLVALADIHDLNKVRLIGHEPDAIRASGNSRYLEAASPAVMLELVAEVRKLLSAPEA